MEHKIVLKGWGYEKWVVNKKEYCGKILFFEKDKKCSFHYHKIKDETFYLQSGKIMLSYSYEDDIEKSNMKVLDPGDSFYVPINLRHRMVALEDSILIEFSSEHFD